MKITQQQEKYNCHQKKEKHINKDAGKKGAESTGNPDPEAENPLKVGNISRFFKVKGIENYKINGK